MSSGSEGIMVCLKLRWLWGQCFDWLSSGTEPIFSLIIDWLHRFCDPHRPPPHRPLLMYADAINVVLKNRFGKKNKKKLIWSLESGNRSPLARFWLESTFYLHLKQISRCAQTQLKQSVTLTSRSEKLMVQGGSHFSHSGLYWCSLLREINVEINLQLCKCCMHLQVRYHRGEGWNEKDQEYLSRIFTLTFCTSVPFQSY